MFKKFSLQQPSLTIILVLLTLLLSACNNSNDNSNNKNISGAAIKGVISNGIVKAYSVSTQDKQLLTETRTNQFGLFNLEFSNDIEADELILIELSVDADTRMRCDLIAGCLDQTTGKIVSFGHSIALPSTFKLMGVASNEDTNSRAYLTPLSHLVVSSAINVSPIIDKNSIRIASRWVNDAFQLSESAISTQPKDITQFNNYPMMTQEQLKQSIISAAIYPDTLNVNWSSGATTIDSIDLKEVLTRAAELAGDLAEVVADNDSSQVATLQQIQSDAEAQIVSLNTSDIVILSQPSSSSAIENEPFTLFVQANSDLQLSYQWYKNYILIPGATSPIYSISNSSLNDSGYYHVAISNSQTAVNSLTASVTINKAAQALQITNQPSSQSVTEGEAINLSVSAIGDGTLSYQWQKNGSLIPGATSSNYFIPASSKLDEGSYRVTISNGSNQLVSNFVNVWVTEIVETISIISQPQSQTVLEGSTASFSVSATGGGYIRYQWRKNGIPIQNAFSPSLNILNADLLDSGTYDVVISNSQGSINSAGAVLSILNATVPVMISQQPQAQTVITGSSVSFNVSASGDGPISYQWFFNGSAINSANAARYDIPLAGLDHQGLYSVLVSNGSSSEQSDSAYLSINLPELNSLELTWDTPTKREDGSSLAFDDISGYIIEYGYNSANLANRIQVANELPHLVVLDELHSGTLYLRIATIDSDDAQGSFSSIISVTIP